MPFVFPDVNTPADTEAVSLGAARIRELKQYLHDMLEVSLDLTTGEILPEALEGKVFTPYGAAGTVLTSTGPATEPEWATSGSLPTGSIMPWATTSLPSGWLEMDGSAALIATYPALAAVLGTTYGGDGVTTFGLPDARGRVLVGRGTGSASDATAWTLAQQRGTEGVTLVATDLPASFSVGTTNQNPYSGQHQNGAQPAGVYPYVTGFGNGTLTLTISGGSQPHSNLQPSLCLIWIIKAS